MLFPLFIFFQITDLVATYIAIAILGGKEMIPFTAWVIEKIGPFWGPLSTKTTLGCVIYATVHLRRTRTAPRVKKILILIGVIFTTSNLYQILRELYFTR